MQLGHLRAADSESAAYSQHCCWQTDKVEQMTSVLQTPHWLLVCHRTEHLNACAGFKSLNGFAPKTHHRRTDAR